MTQEYRQPKFSLPKGAADLILIRHGETEAARPGESFPLKDGHGDPALHPDGEVQAVQVARRLKSEAISAIYVTKLRRTHQTAAPLAQALGLAPVEDPDLHEVHLGDWDGGLYRIKAAQNDPAFQRAFERQEWGEIPRAETTASVQTRVQRGLLRIGAAHPDETVAVVVHGGVIAAAMAVASGSQPFAFRGAENGSISRMVVQGDRITVRTFNDVSHLSG
jgi:probable phosphoglycerate mutase